MLPQMTQGNGMNGGAGKQGMVSSGMGGGMQPMAQAQNGQEQAGLQQVLGKIAETMKAMDERLKIVEQKHAMLEEMLSMFEAQTGQEQPDMMAGGNENGNPNIPQY